MRLTAQGASRCADVLVRKDNACYMRTALKDIVAPGRGLLVLDGNTCKSHVKGVTRCRKVGCSVLTFSRARRMSIRCISSCLTRGTRVARITIMRYRAAANVLGPLGRVTRVMGVRNGGLVISTVDDFNNIPLSMRRLNVSFVVDDTGGYVRKIPNFNFVVTHGSRLRCYGKMSGDLSLSVCSR